MAEIEQNRQGLIYLFTGDGKGKTSAALGTLLRGLGRGWLVTWISWYKESQWQLSEHKFITKLQQQEEWKNQVEMHLMGAGFYIDQPTRIINRDGRQIKVASVGQGGGLEDGLGGDLEDGLGGDLGGGLGGNLGDGQAKVIDDDTPQTHRQAAEQALELASRKLDAAVPPDLLILDEVCNAVSDGLILENNLLALLAARRHAHIVLTGRNATRQLTEQADLVTNMEKVKHPYDENKLAVAGLDY